MTTKTKRWYSVGIESEGPADPEKADALLEQLEGRDDVAGPVVSWGGLAGGAGAQLSVRAFDAVEAGARAIGFFFDAATKADVPVETIAHVDVMTEEYQERWLDQSPAQYVGVTEIANLLGVSRQRVYELRERDDFPKPIAELAGGPVWRRESLNHFIQRWERRPGRPRRGLTDDERQILNQAAHGASLTDVARALGLTPAGFRTRLMTILKRAAEVEPKSLEQLQAEIEGEDAEIIDLMSSLRASVEAAKARGRGGRVAARLPSRRRPLEK